MFQEVCLRFCIGLVSGIQIVGDRVRLVYHPGKFFISIQQISVCIRFLGQVVDVGIGSRIVCIIISIALLAQIILRVTIVCTPTVDNKGVQVRLCNLFTQTGNIGFDVQLHVIISQAVRENLLEHICAI